MTFRNIAATTALTACIAATALQAQEVELAFAHWVGPTHPLNVTGMEPWARSVEEASEGRIRVTIFPAAQLGAAFDHFSMARDGIADISFVNPGNMPGRFPILSLGELPFMFSDARTGSRALHEWYAEHAETEIGDVQFCKAFLHDVSTIHSNAPIVEPGDLRGVAFRPPNGTIGRFTSSLGATSVSVPPSEVRDAMARGMADATGFPWSSLYTWGVHEHVSHHLDLPVYVTLFLIVINRDTWNGLSPENRAVMEAHCTPDWSERLPTGWIALDQTERERMLGSEGHVLNTPTPEQAQMWRDAAAPLMDEWRASVTAAGHDADAIHAGFVEALRRNNALAE